MTTDPRGEYPPPPPPGSAVSPSPVAVTISPQQAPPASEPEALQVLVPANRRVGVALPNAASVHHVPDGGTLSKCRRRSQLL